MNIQLNLNSHEILTLRAQIENNPIVGLDAESAKRKTLAALNHALAVDSALKTLTVPKDENEEGIVLECPEGTWTMQDEMEIDPYYYNVAAEAKKRKESKNKEDNHV